MTIFLFHGQHAEKKLNNGAIQYLLDEVGVGRRGMNFIFFLFLGGRE